MGIKEISERVFERDNGNYIPAVIKGTYTENEHLVNYCLDEGNKDTYYAALILSLYSYILTEEKSYKKALPYLDKIIAIWEKYDAHPEEEEIKGFWYKELRFARGRSHYYKNNFDAAKRDFIWLASHYPNNDIYLEWRETVKYKQLNEIQNIAFYVMLGSILADIFFRKKNIHDLLTIVLAISIFVVLALAVIIGIGKRTLKK